MEVNTQSSTNQFWHSIFDQMDLSD